MNRAPLHLHPSFAGSERRFFCRHHARLFGFFFAPLFVYGYAYPWWYDYPFASAYDVEGPEVEEFEPFYTPWVYSEPAGAYLSEYFVTPDAWLVAMVYLGQENLVYYFDPIARRFIGVLNRSTGDFQHRLGEQGWSDPEAFPFVAPPAIEAAG